MLGPISEILYMESKSRQEFFSDLKSEGKYGRIAGIYHEHLSQKVVGMPDAELINALPESCKWIAHKGAGYEAFGIDACKKRGGLVAESQDALVLTLRSALRDIVVELPWCGRRSNSNYRSIPAHRNSAKLLAMRSPSPIRWFRPSIQRGSAVFRS